MVMAGRGSDGPETIARGRHQAIIVIADFREISDFRVRVVADERGVAAGVSRPSLLTGARPSLSSLMVGSVVSD